MLSEPTRVLHVFGRLGRGGAPMRTLEVLRHLDPRRYALVFCTLSDVVGDFQKDIEASGGRVARLPYGLVRFPGRFRQLLRSERFGVVHSHVYYQSGNILRLAARCGVPVRVAHFRSSRESAKATLRRRLQRVVLRRWIDRFATDILAVSEEAMAEAWGQSWRQDPRCRVVYNGLDPQRFAAPSDRQSVLQEFRLPQDAYLCIHVGRLSAAKNHDRLVRIFAALALRRPEARLLLIGWGEKRIEDALARRIEELGIGHLVCRCGERSDVPRLLKAADVLVFPSLWEGLPGVVLEACAAGTPVVASDLPSIREIASRLGGIELVSLDESDQAWAMRASCPLVVRNAGRGGSVRLPLGESVFGIGTCVDAMCSIWDRPPGGLPVGD